VIHCARVERAIRVCESQRHKNMSEEPAMEFVPQPPVAYWLEAVDVGVGEASGPCGPDLEYDPDMLELETLAAGKAETQFAPAEPPEWPLVRDKAAEVMGRSRDLRVAMIWCRANVNVDGFAGVPAALCLLQGLLDQFWDSVHPMPDPDDGDTFARVSALGGLDRLDGLLGDIRQARLTDDRRLGGLRVRTVEIATERLEPRLDEEVMSRDQIETALRELGEVAATLRTQCAEAQHWAKRLVSVMNERFGVGEAVDLKNLRGMLAAIESVIPAESAESPGGDEGEEAAYEEAETSLATPVPGATRRAAGGGVLRIESRADAVRAIEMVCAYLERSEPTNPAQLLLRRAVRLIDKNFLQLVREVAPDAVGEVARIMGVDPDSIDRD
jgi:type VI secretion system protein ImpA